MYLAWKNLLYQFSLLSLFLRTYIFLKMAKFTITFHLFDNFGWYNGNYKFKVVKLWSFWLVGTKLAWISTAMQGIRRDLFRRDATATWRLSRGLRKGSGGDSPHKVAKFYLINRLLELIKPIIKVFENESIFSKILEFFLPKNHFF